MKKIILLILMLSTRIVGFAQEENIHAVEIPYGLNIMISHFFDIEINEINSVKVLLNGKIERNLTDSVSIEKFSVLSPSYYQENNKSVYMPTSYTIIVSYRENGGKKANDKSTLINNGTVYINVKEGDKMGGLNTKNITVFNPPTNFEFAIENGDAYKKHSYSFVLPVYECTDEIVSDRAMQYKNLLNQKNEKGEYNVDKDTRDLLINNFSEDNLDGFCSAYFTDEVFPYYSNTLLSIFSYGFEQQLFKGNGMDDATFKLFKNILQSISVSNIALGTPSVYLANLAALFSENNDELINQSIILDKVFSVNKDLRQYNAEDVFFNSLVDPKFKANTENIKLGLKYFALRKWMRHIAHREYKEARECINKAMKIAPEHNEIFNKALQTTDKREAENKEK